MISVADKEIFNNKVIPIMNKVRDYLQSKQAEEMKEHLFSPASILAGGIGPDGGMTAHSAQIEMLRRTGKWNSKTVEDYVQMVKLELEKEKITVTPTLENMMIDKMVSDQMPKSSIEYIIRSAAGNSIFGLSNELNKSPLQKEIEEKGEVLYNPSQWEKGLGWGLGATTDFVALGGTSVVNGLKFIGADLTINALASIAKDDKPKNNSAKPKIDNYNMTDDIPMVILPEYREEYIASKKKEKTTDSESSKQYKASTTEITNEKETLMPTDNHTQESQIAIEKVESPKNELPKESKSNGWQNLLSEFGLNGLSDIGHNAGYILAMLPDILVGIFTGKTKSLGLRENLMPIASIVAGMFVRNPLLKMTLIGFGGANLLNKAGHEELDKRQRGSENIYRQYADEKLNPRIENPILNGNTMIATIDKIPVSITLPERVADAYNKGALPLNTLANAILERTDQMQHVGNAQERFEAESRETNRSLTQR